MEQNWKKLKLEFNKIILLHKEIYKIFKQNNISFKKFGFSKKLYVNAIIYSKYLRGRFTISIKKELYYVIIIGNRRKKTNKRKFIFFKY